MDKQKKINIALTSLLTLFVNVTINPIYATEKLTPLNITQVKIGGTAVRYRRDEYQDWIADGSPRCGRNRGGR